MNTVNPELRAIFWEALDHESGNERRAYLERACGADEELRSRVEALLRAHRDAGNFLEEPISTPTLTLNRPVLLEAPGTSIGPYKLLEQIGEGGMGVVYMADQTAPVRRKVALKIIKPGMDTRQVIARFEAERQALALMDHPNIAKVHDGGATEAGRPYFVMELVHGIPITEYCDREQLSIPERLDLFVLVCRAVQHAHQKGIIHRDLKPSNVLVTLIDGAAVPKVIDFGVAKATGGHLTEKSLYTGFAQLIGTPLYMSPEQAELSGVDVDTRSDIYALGVLLYELLTGTTPIDRGTLHKAAYDEIRRIIREQDPPTPSSRLITLGATLSTLSANRQVKTRKLSHEVRGELDWIVMKALEKDRARRYETANDFAADLMRHLTDQPVEACPPSWSYRLGKYARRNRGPLFAAVAVVLALFAGITGSIWQAIRARAAEAEADRRAEETSLVVDYLVQDVFGAAAPEKSQGRIVTVHDMLTKGEKAIPARFGHRPRVEASAREALGRAYYDLGRYVEAAAQLDQAAELNARVLGRDHPLTLEAESLKVRALCPWAVSVPSEPDKAEPIARRVLEARRRILGPDHPQTLESMTSLAHVLTTKQYQIFGAKEALYPPYGTVPDDVLRTEDQTRLNEAYRLLVVALAGQERRLGPDHPVTLETSDTLGSVLNLKGDFVGAESVLRRVVDGRRRVLGPAHSATLQSLKKLGVPIRRLGRLEEAARVFLESVEGHFQTFGPTHIQTSSALGHLIETYHRIGDAAAIRDLCERRYREIQGTPVDHDPYQRYRRAIALDRLALELATLPAHAPFDADLAVRAAVEALALDGGWHRHSSLGAVYLRVGRVEEAFQAFRAAERQLDWAGGSDLHWFAQASTYARRGDRNRAFECFEKAQAPTTKLDSWRCPVGELRAEAEVLLRRARELKPAAEADEADEVN